MKKIVIFLAVLMMVGCSSPKQKTTVDTVHTAQNSLDWAGIYEGTLPAPDYDNVFTTLILNNNGSFKLQEVYYKNGAKSKVESMAGLVQWDQQKPLVYLKDKNNQRVFFVGEGKVIAYRLNGNPIDGNQSIYTLAQNKVFLLENGVNVIKNNNAIETLATPNNLANNSVVNGQSQTTLVGLSQLKSFNDNTSENRVFKEIEVGHALIDCQGVGPMKCLLVRERGTKEWLLHYDPIEGFDYEPGYIYRIKIEEVKLKNVPADRSSVVWKLVEVLHKVKI